MSARPSPRLEAVPAPPESDRRAHLKAVLRITVLSVIASELITLVLLKVLLGYVLVEGLYIALICSAPITAVIADRQLRMRGLIADQRDRLSDLNRRLEARNDDLDAFSRAVAHDLKNPLGAILGMARILLDDPRVALGEETADLLRSISLSAEQASEIVGGLLLLHGVQHEARDLGAVDSELALASSLEAITGLIAESGATVSMTGSFPTVRAHEPWLTQVWVNLLSNAIKYGGSPPEIDVVARAMPEGVVRFEVVDNGDGIPPEDRDRIFREFQRGANTHVEGHGLGLAIVRRIVARLGGQVGVEPADGGGCSFWFTVPGA